MDPTTPTPDQIANVTEAITAALWLGVALAIYAYLSHRTEDNGPTRWHRWRAWYTARYMSSSDSAPAAAEWSANQSVDQSAPTSLKGQTSAAAGAGLGPAADRDLPGLEAEHTGLDTPRVSSYLTDSEFIVFLATQKLRNGKYRLSANDIVKTVRGDRTEVLAIVRQVREPAPEFPPLTDEQQRLRQQLQLDQR